MMLLTMVAVHVTFRGALTATILVLRVEVANPAAMACGLTSQCYALRCSRDVDMLPSLRDKEV